MSFWISPGKSAYVDRFEDALDDEQPGTMTITWKARGIRNLHKGRFAFERFRHMSVDLRPEALRIAA
jgi:hypothetical protein